MKKNLPGTPMYLLVGVALIAIVACATLVRSKKGGVEIGDYSAVIKPEAKLSGSDYIALNSVLRNSRKSLYKIQTFENGNLTSTQGALDEKYMREGLVSEVAKAAETTQFTGSAIQLGFTSSTKPVPQSSPPGGSSTKPAPQSSPPGGSSTMKSARPPPGEAEQAKELVERLKLILER